MSSIAQWLDERMGWRTIKEVLLDRKIPKGVNWLYTLGSVSAFLFMLQAVTGIFLAMHYAPSPDHAYDSVHYLTHEVPLGGFLRGLHAWGASAMVIAVTLHLLRVYFMAAYKSPRELTWVTGVVIFLLVLGFGFTGYLLPWDQKAYWATMVGVTISEQVPMIGSLVAKVMKGGDELGAITLTRFYAIHVLLLPACLLLLIGGHLFLVVWHGISAPPERLSEEERRGKP